MPARHHPDAVSDPALAHRLGRMGWVVLCAAALMMGGGRARADSDHDHDRARHALDAGQVLPLATILARVAREHTGKVLDVELERSKDDGGLRWVYKIKLLTPTGTRLKLQMDAKSGELITTRHKD